MGIANGLRHALRGMVLTATLCTAATAQNYPNKPVRVIVSVTSASVTDIAIRAIGQEYRTRFGQPWLVENRPGGNFFIATEACVRAAPDGYSLCASNSGPMSYNPHIFTQKPYDIEKDLIPVTNLYFVLGGIIVKKDLAAKSIEELRKLATAPGSKLNFGTLGPGSVPDILRQWLNDEWKANFADISYKGGGEVAQALIRGEIDLAYIGLGNMASQLQDGQVRALAIEGSARSKYLPDVPTFKQAGLGNYPLGGPIWWGIHVPAGTPTNLVEEISKQIREVMKVPSLAEFLEKQYLEPAPGSPSEFKAFLAEDFKRVGGVVENFKIPKQ